MSHTPSAASAACTAAVVETRKIPVEVYSRVVGYYRHVNQWNLGKQEEFRDRKEFFLRPQERDAHV